MDRHNEFLLSWQWNDDWSVRCERKSGEETKTFRQPGTRESPITSRNYFLRLTQRNSEQWLFIAVWRWQLQIMTSRLFLVWGRPLFWKADPKLEICEMYLSSVGYFRQEADRRPWLCKSRSKYTPLDVVGVVVSSNLSKRRLVTRTHCQRTHPIGDTIIPRGKLKGWIMNLFPDERTLPSWRVNLATKGLSATELSYPLWLSFTW